MRLSNVVTEKDVDEANEIFKISTMNSLNSGIKTFVVDPRQNDML